jgi:hypothetical protein
LGRNGDTVRDGRGILVELLVLMDMVRLVLEVLVEQGNVRVGV